MNKEEVKNNLRQVLVPEGKRQQLLQPLLSGLISGLSIYAPSLIGSSQGFPLGYYSPDMVSCMALNCPLPQPAHVNIPALIANFFIWYLLIGAVRILYLRWSE